MKRQLVPTIADVAKRAGTSLSTVSRVLNDYPHVRSEVRQNVLKAMKVLRYRPDRVARSLVRRETRTIGLLVADIANPFYADSVRVVTEVLGNHGYNVILTDSQYLPRLHREHIRLLQERRVDGIILGSVLLDDPEAERLVAAGYPCVMFNRRLRSGRGNYVVLDNVEAARGITKHVIGLGHQRIGFIAGPTNTSNAWERLQGFRAAATEAGIQHKDCLIREGHYKTAFGIRVGQEFLKLSDPPSAIVASNDVIALGILHAAGDLGIQVPEHLSVVGLDNIQIAAHYGIQLTTMDAHVAEQAKLAATWILEIINDPDRFARHPFQHVIQPTLVVRRTCGPPRAQWPHGHWQTPEHGEDSKIADPVS